MRKWYGPLGIRGAVTTVSLVTGNANQEEPTTMGIRVLSSRDFRGVVYDSVTDRPLPLPIFHGEDEANHFILWAQREDREPFGDHRSAHYDLLALNDSYNEWLEKCCNEYGELTEESARELEES